MDATTLAEPVQGEVVMTEPNGHALAESRPANEAFLYGWLANRIGQPA